MKKLAAIILVVVLAVLFLYKDKFLNKQPELAPVQQKDQSEQKNLDEFILLSTKPDPLDEVVIVPAQTLEFKFNRQVSMGEFKYRFDPQIEHDIEIVDSSPLSGTTFRITFKKPLEVGSGYTLFVLPNTNSIDKKTLGKEYIYHFRTINYKGV